MDQLVASLRALAISRKSPSTLDDILSDYAEFEGCPIDVKKYGFETIEELLSASGEFKLSMKLGKTFLIPKPKTVTAHITKMVKRQKSVKKKSVSKMCQSVSVSTPKARRKAKKRRAAQNETLSNNSTSENSTISAETPTAPAFPPSRVYYNSQSLQQGNLPPSTLVNFHSNFPEPIANYADLEVAIALEVWAVFTGVQTPVYNVYLNPNQTGFCCTVFVASMVCSTDPASYESPLQAKIEASYVALQIIHSTHQLRLYPVFSGGVRQLLQKMFEGLKNFVSGVPCALVPKMFRDMYGETLPKNWLQVVKASRLFDMRTSMSGDAVISVVWY